MNFRQKFAEYNQLNTIGLGFSPVGAAWYRRKSNTETKDTRSTEVNPIPRPSTGISPEEGYTIHNRANTVWSSLAVGMHRI